MKLTPAIVICLFMVFGNRLCFSQSEWKPIATPQITLDNVVVAKVTIDANGTEQISILIPKYLTETRVRTVNKTVFRLETRTRKVKLPDRDDEVMQD